MTYILAMIWTIGLEFLMTWLGGLLQVLPSSTIEFCFCCYPSKGILSTAVKWPWLEDDYQLVILLLYTCEGLVTYYLKPNVSFYFLL